MLKNKRLNKHFKKAQQIVELALVLPFFIVCFTFVFQLMVETYAKYKFSYIFTNSIARAVERQQQIIFTDPILDYSNIEDYNFRNEVGRIMSAAISSVPNNGVEISSLQTSGINNYMSGIFMTNVRRIFFRNSGFEYFYFIIPINRIYFKTMVLNVSEDDFVYFSNWYFPVFALLYSREMEGTGGGTGTGGSGTGTGGSGPIPTEPEEAEPPAGPAGFGGGGPIWGEAEIGG